MKKIIVLALWLLLISALPLVYADITPSGSTVNVIDCQANNANAVSESSSSHIFYHAGLDRWYVFYGFLTGGYVYPYYSYSDSGDPSTWNAGGNTMYGISNSWATHVKPPYQFSVYYNETQNLGHLAVNLLSAGEIYYRNFTITTGSIDFGSIVKIEDEGAVVSNSLDIYADSSRVYFGTVGYLDGDYRACLWVCADLDGYNSAWQKYYWKPFDVTGYKATTALMPMNNGSILQFVANAQLASPLQYKMITPSVTSNSSSTGTTFSDNNVLQVYESSQYYFTSWGLAYTEDYGCIVYADHSTENEAYAFIFDFETMTKSDEYLAFNFTSSNLAISCGASVHNEEFFVSAIDAFDNDVTDKDYYITEYQATGYNGYFNYTGAVKVLDDYTNDWQYTGLGSSMYKYADLSNGTILLLSENNDYAVITTVLLEGFVAGAGEYTVSWFGLYGWFFIGCAGVAMMVIAPSWLALKIRGGISDAPEILERAMYALLVFVIGFGLVMAWLGGF